MDYEIQGKQKRRQSQTNTPKSKHRLPPRSHRLMLLWHAWFRGGVAPAVTRKSQRHQLLPVCHGEGKSSRFRSSWSISVTALEASLTVGAPHGLPTREARPSSLSFFSLSLAWRASEHTTMSVHLSTSADDGAVRRTVTRAAGIGLPISYWGLLIPRPPWPCRQPPLPVKGPSATTENGVLPVLVESAAAP